MFSSGLLLLFAIDLIPIPPIAYSAYRAFNIRRALAVRLYRSQALGVILVALSFIAYMFLFDLYNGLGLDSNLFSVFQVGIGFAVPPVVTFYWIDASVRTARRSDPLLREVFHWRIVRLVLWAYIIPVFLLLVGAVVGSTLYAAIHGQLNSPSSSPPGLLFLLLISPIFVVAISGLDFLRRASKWAGDKSFSKHLRYLGLFIFFVLISFGAIFIPNPVDYLGSLLFQVEVAIPEIVGSYYLYQSIRCLVPLNRFVSGA